MQDSSKRKRKWVAPLVCAAVVLAFLIALLALPVLALADGGGVTAEILAIALFAVPVLAVIAGVVIVLVQRLREIRGGEEEDAKKY